jgi:hypothetical protein
MRWTGLSLALWTLFPVPGLRAQSNDPQVAAFDALRAASSSPVSGSAEAGSVRFLGFDVAASGFTPAQRSPG